MSQKSVKRQALRRRLLKADLFGWLGAVCLVTAYLLVSFGVMNSKVLAYQLLNLVGATGLIVDGIARKAMPSVAANFVWALIALVALASILL